MERINKRNRVKQFRNRLLDDFYLFEKPWQSSTMVQMKAKGRKRNFSKGKCYSHSLIQGSHKVDCFYKTKLKEHGNTLIVNLRLPLGIHFYIQ